MLGRTDSASQHYYLRLGVRLQRFKASATIHCN